MALTRAYEEHEVPEEIRRLYADVRLSFDLPFVPTLFKVTAIYPGYLRAMWDDLGPVVRSREFHAAGEALEEYVRSQAIRGGWRFPDQQKALAAQKFAQIDVNALRGSVMIFQRALPRLALFTRLLQRGYAGGQAGRITSSKHAAALSRIATLNIPSEKDAPLRVWLIYSDFKRTTGARHTLSAMRVLSPFPGYLASVWTDMKRLLNDSAFQRARDDAAKRCLGHVVGLPVRDHRAQIRGLGPADWREIEESVDGFARQLPQFAIAAAVWHRSFPQFSANFLAA
jgi:hypothetical protein